MSTADCKCFLGRLREDKCLTSIPQSVCAEWISALITLLFIISYIHITFVFELCAFVVICQQIGAPFPDNDCIYWVKEVYGFIYIYIYLLLYALELNVLTAAVRGSEDEDVPFHTRLCFSKDCHTEYVVNMFPYLQSSVNSFQLCTLQYATARN